MFKLSVMIFLKKKKKKRLLVMGILSIFNTKIKRGEKSFLKELTMCVKNTYYSQPKKKKKVISYGY